MRRFFLPIIFIFMAPAILLASRLDGGSDTEAALDVRSYPAWMDEVIEPPLGVDSANVYSFTCEIPSRKPDVFTIACADFGERVNQISWDRWSATGSAGRGIYGVNDCNPNCAEGTIHEIPVRIWLEDVTTDGHNYYLNTLKIVPVEAMEGSTAYRKSRHFNFNTDIVIDGKKQPGAIWDVSRDWKDFPELRLKLPS